MKFFITIIKRFLFYFFVVFASYLFVVNFTVTYYNLIDGIIKSFILALLMMPLSITSLLPATIVDKSICEYLITIERPFDEGIKLVRQYLKTLTNIILIESDMDEGKFNLESEFSIISIEVKGKLDSSFLLYLTSKPKSYLSINNYNLYQKDLKNIIQLLKINIDDETFDLDEFDRTNWESEVMETLKTFYPLKYRYYKIMFAFLFTLIASIYFYNIFLEAFPSVATIFFFSSFIMYAFYILSKDLCQIKHNMCCPECKEHIYSNDSFLVLQHKKNFCPYCDRFE